MSAVSYSYAEVVEAIKSQCRLINLTYSTEGDGRITSAVKETEYLTALKTGLNTTHPTLTVEIPKDRYWYDIRINNIPINLKLTTGGTDNAFNKVAVIYTLTGVEVDKRNMNYNEWFGLLKTMKKKAERDIATEYHYLAVDKATGRSLLKSILDIHCYKTNPCNILQINWKHEFANESYACTDYKEKGVELLKAVQTSIQKLVTSMSDFLEFDLDSFYPAAASF